jgi:phage minor structural protein
MILLNGHTLTPKLIFQPEGMPLNLTENAVSTASMTLGPDAPEVKVDDWLLDNVEPGKGIVWRVKGVDTTYETQTRTVQLEHVLATLRDELLFGEITTKAIAGSNTGTVSAERALRYVLSRQSIWTLGDFEFDRKLPYSFNNQTIFQALETICGTLDGWRWEYDLTALPFRLHVRKQRNEIGSELRMGRNLLTLKRTVDRSSMYTRFYPVGARNMHIDGDYVSKNESAYGVVSKTETDQSITKKELLRAWAQDRLERHCEPNVTVTISALELAEATGEALDRFTLGYPCQVPLPEYGTTILERVTKLAWGDKLREPERVTVTLANQLNDVTNIIKQLSSSGGRNAGGGAKTQEEDHAWIVDTADHVGLVAEAIIGRDGETVDWSRVSSIIVDGEGIHQQVTKAQGDIIVANTRIDMNEQAITLEATRASTAESSLSSRITVEAGRITSEVENRQNADTALSSRITQTSEAITAEVTRATTAEGTLSGRITVNADKVSLVVKDVQGGYEVDSASIVAGINGQTGSYVKIKAKTIDLDGYVTASELNVTTAKIDNLMAGNTTAAWIKANQGNIPRLTVGNDLTFKSHGVYWQSVTINGTSYHLMGYVG